ncbi:MAG: hypothetical protein PHC56_01750 [Herbinix sp.]|nr:hypothetical protein [Herbinix sp.]
MSKRKPIHKLIAMMLYVIMVTGKWLKIDGNGWIDENDSVFSRLKVWTKDAEGNDYLMDLKEADVGAIYLGNADTQFSLKNDENKLNAEIKKTGIYLRESSGVVGTLNHVDMVI